MDRDVRVPCRRCGTRGYRAFIEKKKSHAFIQCPSELIFDAFQKNERQYTAFLVLVKI